MAVKAPFRFARINRWIYEPAWGELVSLDVPFSDGLSGEATVEITATSSILVGGDRRKATKTREGEVRPFRLPDGAYAIPGSTLQGMTRAILEIAAFGRLGPRIADRKFGIRDLSRSETAKAHYQRRLSNSKAGWLVNCNGQKYIVPCKYARIHLDNVWHFREALLDRSSARKVCALYTKTNAKERYEWFLGDKLNGDKERLDETFCIEKKKVNHHNRRRAPFSYSRCHYAKNGQTHGTLVLTGKPEDSTNGDEICLRRGHKKLEFVFHCPDRKGATKRPKTIPVTDETWKAFEYLHLVQPGRPINPNWEFWESEFKEGNPVPVFYWGNDTQIENFGMAFAFKAAHSRSTHDLLANSNSGHRGSVGEMELDLPHLIFGVAAEQDGGRGLKRRARFSLARAGKNTEECPPCHPSILLGPKPSYVGLYVRQRHGDGQVENDEPLATYSPLETLRREKAPDHLRRPELSGVKIWPARGAEKFTPPPIPKDPVPSKEIQTRLFTLPPGTVFESRLTFHNLRRVELGALLWALSFGEPQAFAEDGQKVTKRHRLGMGKPLGLGEVAVRVIGLKTEAARCPAGGDPTGSPTATGLVQEFENHMASDTVYGSEWRNSKQVQALLKAATPSYNPVFEFELRYMILSTSINEFRNAAANGQYMPDYVEGDEKRRNLKRVARTGQTSQSEPKVKVGSTVRIVSGASRNLRNRIGKVQSVGTGPNPKCEVLLHGAERSTSLRRAMFNVVEGSEH